jgi:hypothetical protein
VYGIQGKKIKELKEQGLQHKSFLIACLENIADLVHHWNGSTTRDKNLAIKVSKYIYRILFCLREYLQLNLNKEDPLGKDKTKELFTLSQKVLDYRFGKVKLTDEEINQFITRFGLTDNSKLSFTDTGSVLSQVYSFLKDEFGDVPLVVGSGKRKQRHSRRKHLKIFKRNTRKFKVKHHKQ